MVSTVETYREAAREHMERAQWLYENERYFEAHYFFGLAVECHLRAYLRRTSDEFDPRHSLDDLARHSGFYRIVPPEMTDRYSRVFQILNQRWRANHRYYSRRQLLDYMNELKAEFSQRGDRWKNLCRTMLNLAYEVYNLGEKRWNDWQSV